MSHRDIEQYCIELHKMNSELRDLNAELLEAAKGVLDGFGQGVFVRNTAYDHESGWAIKAFPYLAKLGQLQSAITKAEAMKN
jgi:hypothetical protein